MDFLERIPTRWLLAAAALACLVLWAAPSAAAVRAVQSGAFAQADVAHSGIAQAPACSASSAE